jgi:hypothetical protein
MSLRAALAVLLAFVTLAAVGCGGYGNGGNGGTKPGGRHDDDVRRQRILEA